MASRIAALQAKLGGGAMIMGGMRPGGARPIRKKKQRRRASLDNSALLDRTVVSRGNRKKKKIKLDFDELEDDDHKKADPFQSVSADINMKKTKAINGDDSKSNSNDNQSKKKKKFGMRGGGMGGLLAKAGGFKRKSKAKNKNTNTDTLPKPRERGQSRSFTKGVTSKPLISIQPSYDSEQKNDRPTGSKTPAAHIEDSEVKLVEVLSKKHGKRHLRLFVDIKQYIECKKGAKGKGLVIEGFIDSKYGKAIQENGVKKGWKLTKISKQDTTKMSFFIIKNQLANQAQMNKIKGYDVTFEGEYNKSDTNATEQKSEPKKVAQMEPTLKCELVKEEMGTKVIRLFESYNKYFEGTKGDNGKGMVINAVKSDKLKGFGIGIGWKISKLGKRNVVKTSFIMLKNQLTAQASTAKKNGYELTFMDTNAKQNSISTPNSPNIKNKTSANVPQSTPLNPVTAPKINAKVTLKSKTIPEQKEKETKYVKPKESKPKKVNTEQKEKDKGKDKGKVELAQAKDPFNDMKPIDIADTKKKENISGKKDMERVRKNSLPTTPDKPKHRPKLSKSEINKFKPPTTPPKDTKVPKQNAVNKKIEPKQKTVKKEKEEKKTDKSVKKDANTGYKAPKSCEIVEDNGNTKSIKLYQEFSKFFTAAASEGNKGFAVKTLKSNEFGNALKDLGIDSGWKITECANKKLGNKMFAMLKNQISAAAKKYSAQGYIVIFEGKSKAKTTEKVSKPKVSDSEDKKEQSKSKKPVKEKTPPAPEPPKVEIKPVKEKTVKKEKEEKKTDKSVKKDANKGYKAPKSCEIVEDNGNTKSIKLYQEFSKFFSAEASAGNKGFAVKTLKSNEFGNALKDLGIDSGWKITECANKKLGNKMFAMLKNQISAAAKKSPSNGYIVIFEGKSKAKTPEKVSKPKVSDSDDKKVQSKPKKPAKEKTPSAPEPPKEEIKPVKEKTPPAPEPPKKEVETEKKQKEKADNTDKAAKTYKIKPKTAKTKPLPTGPKPALTIKPKQKTKTNKITLQTKPENVKKEKSFEEKKNDIKPKQTTTSPSNPALAAASKIHTTDTKPKKGLKVEGKKGRKSSYEAPKSCELIQDINSATKKIKLYQDFQRFFSAQGAQGNKGFAVNKMNKNEFGNALSDLGIDSGWTITECANKKLGNKMFAMLKNQISAAAKKNSAQGYIVIFQNPNATVEKATEEQKTDPTPIKKKSNAYASKEEKKTNTKIEKTVKKKSENPKEIKTVKAKKKTSIAELETATTPTIEPLAAAAKISTTDTPKSYKTNTVTKSNKLDKDALEEKKFKKNRKSSYEAPKSCEILEDNGDKKKIKLYQEYSKFFTAAASDGNKGFAVKTLKSNEFGNALKDLGIDSGWKITECANKKLGNKMFAMLKNQISAAAKKSPLNGYIVIFEGKVSKPKVLASDDKKEQSKSPKKISSPRQKQRVEVIESSENSHKLRVYHSMDKYIRSAAEKGPKGYVIQAFAKPFGDDLKECGVDIGWKLMKLGQKDVSKAFYQMTKTNLDVEFRNTKNGGYEVTFAPVQ